MKIKVGIRLPDGEKQLHWVDGIDPTFEPYATARAVALNELGASVALSLIEKVSHE